ncbi:MAG: hypothetical protein JEZ08_21645 [Clostridiales bacterium]|nr:hypothetical protein [Clostridiales bacterium]
MFKKKYESDQNIQCKGFIRIYCRGGRHNECKRRLYLRETGDWPEANYMPNGYMARD